MRAGILSVSPGMADRDWLRLGLVPSIYHHLPRTDPKERLATLRRVRPTLPDPVALAATVRAQWAMMHDLVVDHDIDLYVVNSPQSTFLRDDYYKAMYDDYERLLRSMVGDIPYLDLARFLRDDEFYDLTHPTLPAAQRLSRRVAQFVRETEATGHHVAALGPVLSFMDPLR
jgi:hypothetical protein